MFRLLPATAAFLAVAWVTWTARPGPVLRRVVRVIGLVIVLAFVGALTAKANPMAIGIIGGALYTGLAITRSRRKSKGTWPNEPQRWPGWFVVAAAYLVYAYVGSLALSRQSGVAFFAVDVGFYVVLVIVIVSRAKGWQPWTKEGRNEVTSTAQRQLEQMRRFSERDAENESDKT